MGRIFEITFEEDNVSPKDKMVTCGSFDAMMTSKSVLDAISISSVKKNSNIFSYLMQNDENNI